MIQVKLLLTQVIVILTTLSMLTGCDKDDNPVSADTLDTLIRKDTSLSIFNEVLSRTHLNTFTTGPGPFTIFAPTNKAYKQIGINSVADLKNIDSNQLVLQTTWLIAAGSRSSDVLVGSNLTISTQVGTTIFAQTTTNATYFNGIKAKERDIKASNGVLHVLDEYLSPTFGTTTVTLSRFPETFKLFSQAITRAGTAATTPINKNTSTVLAPTNAAMIAGGFDSVTISKATPASLATLIKYHIIGTLYYSFALRNIAYKTEQGSNITFSVGQQITVTGKNNTANIIQPFNFTSSNGVIHTLNAVLKP